MLREASCLSSPQMANYLSSKPRWILRTLQSRLLTILGIPSTLSRAHLRRERSRLQAQAFSKECPRYLRTIKRLSLTQKLSKSNRKFKERPLKGSSKKLPKLDSSTTRLNDWGNYRPYITLQNRLRQGKKWKRKWQKKSTTINKQALRWTFLKQ